MQRNIVLDTNCLLQIIARKSKNYFLWEGFLNGDYCLCYTTEILEEYDLGSLVGIALAAGVEVVVFGVVEYQMP